MNLITMMRRYGGNFGSVGMVFMMIVQIAFWVLIIRAISALIQNGGKFSKGAGGNEALHILRKKYANGEINKKEYLEKKKDLLA